MYYINDLPNSCDLEVLLYADDDALLCKDKTHDGLKSKSEKEFQKIESWVISNKLTINYTKTNCVFFLKPSKNIDCKNLCIRAFNGNITEQNVDKYLEVCVDKQLSWQHHIQSIVKKLTTARGIISKLRHYAPPPILKNVYFSIAYRTHIYNMVLLHGEILPPNLSTKFKCNKTALLKQLPKLHFSKQNLAHYMMN